MCEYCVELGITIKEFVIRAIIEKVDEYEDQSLTKELNAFQSIDQRNSFP